MPVRCRLMLTAVLVSAIAIPAPSASQTAAPVSLTADQWRADLAFLATTLPEKHPKPFGRTTQAQWQAAVTALDTKIPSLRRDEIAVGFMRLVAMIGDAHTVAYAANLPPGFHLLPIRLYWFADGLHVIAAAKGHESLLGLRLTRVGTTAVDSAVSLVAQTFVAENAALRKTGAAQSLATLEILRGLHLIDNDSKAPLTFTGPKGTVPVTLAPLETTTGIEWVRWTDALGVPAPLARRRPQAWYWHQRDESTGLYFIQYNRCQDSPELKVADFVAQALGAIDSLTPRAVVVDVRYNGGGSSSLLLPLVNGLAKRRALNAPDRLFVLVGRNTFSSALMNAMQFRQLTKAMLVGEPTGGKPNHFGETRTFTLPHSGMSIQHSTKYFQQQPKDEDALYPDVSVEVRSSDYAAGRDPVLDEVVRRIGAKR